MIKIRLQLYPIWFLVNFLLCLLPLLVSLIANQSINLIFLGFISFCFTLLISNLYLSSNFKVLKNEGLQLTLLFWLTILWVFILFTIFVFYPNIPSIKIKEIFEHKLDLITVLVLITTVLFALFLNVPTIEELASNIKYREKLKKSDQIKVDFQKYRDELKEEDKNE